MTARKTVVVTGAFGFIGLALAARLVAQGHRVVGVGRRPRVDVVLPSGLETVYGDSSEAARFLGPEVALVHLAGGGGEAACREDPVRAVRDIVRATSLLVAEARGRRTRRVLYASTIAVYGTFRDHGRPYTEEDATQPDDLYGTLKEAAEHIVVALCGGTALRIANVYGAGIGVDMGIHGVAERFARAAASGGELTLYGDGSQELDIVQVDDVVAAFEAAIDADTLPGAINVGGGRLHTIRALADAALSTGRALGKSPTLASKPAPAGKVWPTRSLDISRAEAVLGWAPRVPLGDGMNGLVTMMHKELSAKARRGEE